METYSVLVGKYDPTDPRLGRHIRHDSRSLQYLVQAADISSLASIEHPRFIPVLDQGQIGSCTGNAAVGCVGSGLFWPTIEGAGYLHAGSRDSANADEAYAVDVYGAATLIDDYGDSYPPTDTGSDGLSVAKVLTSRGVISGYRHAISLEAVLTALAEQPVIVGIEWHADMFTPDEDGRINISGEVQGGHEYVLDQLDVENQRVWMCNSWGESWGVNGRGYFTYDDFATLLAANGDCTVFTPLTQAAPTPQPAPDKPGPLPDPAPDPTPIHPPPDPELDNKNAMKSLVHRIRVDLRRLENRLTQL